MTLSENYELYMSLHAIFYSQGDQSGQSGWAWVAN